MDDFLVIHGCQGRGKLLAASTMDDFSHGHKGDTF
jgi:hypothetical protein